MDLPLGNFFEVTINSNKLFAFIEDIFAQLKQHEMQLTAVSAMTHRMVSSVQQKTQNQSNLFDLQLQKMKKSMQQEFNYMRLFMKDVDKKATDKMNELQMLTHTLKDKVVKNKIEVEEDMAIKYSYLDKKIAPLPALEEELKNTNQIANNHQQNIDSLKESVSTLSENNQNEHIKIKEVIDFLMERINQVEQQLKNQNEQMISMRNSFMEQSRAPSRSLKRKQNKSMNNTQAFNNIINRMDQVESKLTQDNLNKNIASSLNVHSPRRSIISNNKVVKSGASLNKSGFYNKKEGKSDLQSIILQKLARIQSINIERFQYFQRQIYKFSNKAEIVDEHIGILSRKLQKQKFKIQQTAQQIKHFDDKKVDEKMIENLKNMIKKLAKDIEESLEKKVNADYYEKDKNKFGEKICTLNQIVLEKAQKNDVKKGLTFLQEKIKEIIIVLADQRGMTQDGAIKKTPYKCLSCDKDLEADKIDHLLKGKETNSNITRCNTQQVRKRIRMLNNTISTVQQDTQ